MMVDAEAAYTFIIGAYVLKPWAGPGPILQ
jgi:hypothetical protein